MGWKLSSETENKVVRFRCLWCKRRFVDEDNAKFHCNTLHSEIIECFDMRYQKL